LLLIDLGILTLFFITREGRTWEYLAVLFALASTFTHGYGALFLLVVIIYKKNRKSLPFFIMLTYPLYVIISKTTDLDFYSTTLLRESLGEIFSFIGEFGILTLMNPIIQAAFLIGGSLYFLKEDENNSNLRLIFIWTAVFFLAWLVFSLPFIIKLGNITLHDADRFLFYLVFPAAIFGGFFIHKFSKLDRRLEYVFMAGLILIFIYPAVNLTEKVTHSAFPFEKSYPGLLKLKELSDSDDIIITSQGAWVYAVAERKAMTLFVTDGSKAIDIFDASEEVFLDEIESEEVLFEGINSAFPVEKPSYI
jgi:hypothetical protein